MKLCSQCEFIYEDDQEHCDMDGAELVYEPTLEHVFPNNALQARTELERRGPARLIIPLSRLPRPETSVARPNVVATRSRSPLQIAAVAVIAAVSFMAFYATPRLFQTGTQTAPNRLETQNSELKTSQPTPSVAVARAAASSEKLETQETKHDASRSSNELETRNAKRETAFPPLPGLKPLPRLKPLPTLKPLPRLADRSRSVGASRTAIVMNTKERANTKKESRFGSFLKKTGRILTKPFKS